MSLILCRQEPVKHPYYIDVLGIHIHSSQELCYIVYNHPVLVMDDFLDDLLVDFIRKDLDMDYLAGRMEKLVETGTRPEEVGKAAARYGKILEYPRDKVVEDLFLAKVYNNLGACYAMMFQFHKALGCYDKAYELGKDDALLKRIYFLTVFAPELDVKDKYQSVFTDERKRTWSGEMDLAALEAGQAEEVRALRALFKKDPIKRMSGAAEMVRRWKQEYRMMV